MAGLVPRRARWRASIVSALLVAGLGAGMSPSQASSGVELAPSGAASEAQEAPLDGGEVTGPFVAASFDGSVAALPVAEPSSEPAVEEGGGSEAEPALAPGTGSEQGDQPAAADVARSDAAGNDAVTPTQFSAASPNFEGIAGGNPPDPTGDVGPNHYVEMINSQFAIWDKAGTQLAGPVNINSLWNDSNAATNSNCEVNNLGDPIVVYDQLADRWLLSQFNAPRDAAGNPTAPFALCVAISQTADPTQAYHLYEFPTTNFPDYPKFGVWPDGYYVTTHEGEHGIYVMDRSSMLNGNPAVMIRQAIANVGGGRGARLLPSDWDGATPPPAGAANQLIRSVDGEVNGGADRLELYGAAVNWQANPPTLTVNGPQTITPAAFDTQFSDCFTANRACVPQPGTAQEIDNLSNRLMWRLQYRNFGTHEAMVVNQTVDFDNTDRSAIRWYELRRSGGGAWAIHQQGTYSPDPVNRFMGSMAMDGAGNIAVGYTATWDDPANLNEVFNSVRYAGRLASDPLGLLPAAESVLVAGTSSKTNGPRWGDYTQMAVDPVDDCTFWYVGQYNTSQTRIGAFKFPSCDPVDLHITKTDSPDPVLAGEELTYTINVTNQGTNTAQEVVVTDTLPAGVTLLNTAPACTNNSGTLTCPLGTLLAGQSAGLVIQVQVPANFLGSASTATLTNTATVAAVDQAESDPADNTATAMTTVRASADLGVTKVCKPDEPASAGSTAYCDIIVDNLGPSDATGVQLRDVLTSATPFDVTSVTASPAGTCSPTSASDVTSFTTNCNLGTIAAGGRTTVRVSVTADDVAQVNDVATVSSATDDPDTTNNQAQGRVDFEGSADLSLEKTGPPEVVAGEDMTYVITVDNAGPSTAHDVQVVDQLPEGVTFVSVVPSRGSCTNGQPGGRDLVCGLGDMAAGEQATITVNVAVSPDVADRTILFNQAVVSSATADPDNDDVRDSVGTTVSTSADLSVTKSDSPDPVLAGDLLTYTITVSNAGPSTARVVEIRDELPAGTTFVGGEDSNGATVCTEVQTRVVVCGLQDLAPGATATVYLTVAVEPDVPAGAQLSNTVTVSSATSDPDASDNEATSDTAVATSAELWLDKTAELRSGNPSPTVVYTLVVHNNAGCETDAQSTPTPTCGDGGPSDAQDIVVTDRLPLDPKKLKVQFLSPQCSYAQSTHTVTCTASTLQAGAEVRFVIEAQVQGSSGTITNSASLTSSTPDPVTANNVDDAAIVHQGGTGKGRK